MSRVILTGGGGFIGVHAVPELIKRGYEVHVADINTKGVAWLPREVQLHECDLFDVKAQAELMRTVRPTHLLHLAWYAVHGKFWTSPENIRWVQTSLELLRNFLGQGGTRAVLAGTCAEYDWNSGICIEDSTPLKPATLYGICKNALQQMFMGFCRQNGMSGAWGRVFLLYGPYENPARLVPSVIRSLLKGEEAKCTHGRQIRDIMHVEDVASALAALLDSEVEDPVNIASGRPVMIKEVIETIAGQMGKNDLLSLGAIPFPEHEPLLLVADTNRLQKEVGWKPRYSLESGLEQTISWWRTQGK